jgi:two-component system, sensor histidine kinase LadS
LFVIFVIRIALPHQSNFKFLSIFSSSKLIQQYPHTLKYSIFGLAFGFCFPILSILADVLFFHELPMNLESIFNVHKINKLHFVIDTAPLFLGLSFGLAGFFYDKVSRMNNSLTEVVKKQHEVSEELQTANQQLEEASEELNQKTEEISVQNEDLIQQKKKLENALLRLEESINYAKRIPQAVLPDLSQFADISPDFFLLHYPKDIVGGDFYWTSQRGNQYLIACGDCTGHGVAGAFMTVIAISILNYLVNERRLISPAHILKQADKRLLETLHQSDTTADKDRIHEGFDLAICLINPEAQRITFASAKRPLLFFSNGVLQEIKGDKMPIGGTLYGHKMFNEHTIYYNPDDTFYLFTDGFTDQFGGKNNEKFKIHRLRELLTQLQGKEMGYQRYALDTTIKQWKYRYDQTDDILMMGFKL